jgi:phosphate starvation-inducible PhoH-like protein
LGVAGTGKSYCSAGYAADMLRNKQICRIVLTRPAVDCDEDLGALPGELDEKFAPYIEPFKDILIERLGKSATEYYIKRKQIDIRPLSFMRGSTFKGDGSKGVIVILDEAQNTTKNQMKMFLSRIGSNCKLLINGDMEQSDIRGTSGLQDAVNRLEGIPSIGMVEFDEDDIVRDPMCKAIILAYRHAG